MGFTIGFLPKDSVDSADVDHNPASPSLYGRIVIGAFSERFYSSLSYWSATEYRMQWKQAASRIVEGAESSALITSMIDPKSANWVIWWPMWRVEKGVYIQNQLLMMDQLPGDFDETSPYRHVGEHEAESEDGDKISEWFITIDELETFLHCSTL